RAFRWKDLFWRRRGDVRSRMRFLLFGHALYEKALAPFSGITARGVILPASPVLMQAPMSELAAYVNVRLAHWLGDRRAFSATRDLAPVPVLGVPGWCDDNEREEYYDDAEQFRSPREGHRG